MRILEFRSALTKLAPQRTFASVSERAQLVLVPADQRRDQQTRKAQVIIRLDREFHGREQVLHGHRLVQMQARSEEHTSELQSLTNLVCRLLLEKKKKKHIP